MMGNAMIMAAAFKLSTQHLLMVIEIEAVAESGSCATDKTFLNCIFGDFILFWLVRVDPISISNNRNL